MRLGNLDEWVMEQHAFFFTSVDWYLNGLYTLKGFTYFSGINSVVEHNTVLNNTLG